MKVPDSIEVRLQSLKPQKKMERNEGRNERTRELRFVRLEKTFVPISQSSFCKKLLKKAMKIIKKIGGKQTDQSKWNLLTPLNEKQSKMLLECF